MNEFKCRGILIMKSSKLTILCGTMIISAFFRGRIAFASCSGLRGADLIHCQESEQKMLQQYHSEALKTDSQFVIDPQNVGGITPSSTREDVVKIFGSENVEPYDVPVGEGMTVEGTRVYGGTNNQLTIEWKETGTPERITIGGIGTKWKTREGITVGSGLDDVETANGKPFKLTGFEWDYAGRTVSWEGGKLPKQFQFDFAYTKVVSQAEEAQVIGDRDFSSSHPVMQKKQLRVNMIYVRW